MEQGATYNFDDLYKAYKKKGYNFFESEAKNYNINIFGIRDRESEVNKFNDYVGVMWVYKGQRFFKIYKATTKAGLYYLQHPMNGASTGIIVEDQYEGVFELGLFKGYTALRQVKPMRYYNDTDKDSEFDFDEKTISSAIRGSHLHAAGINSVQVDKWSAACQVLARRIDFNELIDLCKKSAEIYGNKFTYTLFKKTDIK